MPGRIRHLHRQLVGELTLAVFGEPGASDRPGFRFFGTGDDANPHTARRTVRRPGGRVLGRRLGILDGRSPELPRRLHAGLRGSGNQHVPNEVRRQRRRELQVAHLVIAPFEADRARCSQQTLNDGGVLHQPRIALVMRRQVVERRQIVLESSRHHVEMDAPAVQVRERGDHLGDAVRVQIDGLDRHQRAQPIGRLEGDLQDRVFAPARDLLQLANARSRLRQCGRRASREDLQAVIGRGGGHIDSLGGRFGLRRGEARYTLAASREIGLLGANAYTHSRADPSAHEAELLANRICNLGIGTVRASRPEAADEGEPERRRERIDAEREAEHVDFEALDAACQHAEQAE